MNARTATWAALISGFCFGMIAWIIQCRHRPADGRDMATLFVAMAIPVAFVHFSKGDDMRRQRSISIPPNAMSKETQEASGYFTRATEILRDTPSTPPGVENYLGCQRAKTIREISHRLCDALENGGALETIDKHAKALGMEVLGVQQLTLTSRMRKQ